MLRETKTEHFFRKGYSLIDGTGVWSDVIQVFIPRLLGALKSVPLPRVEYTSRDVDLVLDGIDFTSASRLRPRHISPGRR